VKLTTSDDLILNFFAWVHFSYFVPVYSAHVFLLASYFVNTSFKCILITRVTSENQLGNICCYSLTDVHDVSQKAIRTCYTVQNKIFSVHEASAVSTKRFREVCCEK
jgi:hypothetical protein